jgi:hypothetical protein
MVADFRAGLASLDGRRAEVPAGAGGGVPLVSTRAELEYSLER